MNQVATIQMPFPSINGIDIYSLARAGKFPYTGRLALSSISIKGRPTYDPPPSTQIIAPVTYDAPSVSNHVTAELTSCGEPSLRAGRVLFILSIKYSPAGP
mmetsp:Transcript_23342/g.26165  ORF Transcript_23342/g.26165 Transcript_23342/m.26165 type:complete len:101 (+) Transcript_23342:150-452(+)